MTDLPRIFLKMMIWSRSDFWFIFRGRVEWGNTGHFCLGSSCDGVSEPISINKHSLERLFIWQHFCHANLMSGFNILQARPNKAQVLFF